MRRFWDTRDYMTEGRAQLAAMLALPGATDHPVPFAKALAALAELALWQADLTVAEPHFGRALARWRELGNGRGVADSLVGLGYCALERGDFVRAEALVAEATVVARQTGDRHGEAQADEIRAMGLAARGRHDEAERVLLATHAAMVELGDRSNTLGTLNDLAGFATARGDVPVALERWEGVRLLSYEVGERWCLATYLEGMARILAEQGDAERGATVLGAAAAWREATNAPVLNVVGATEAYDLLREPLGADAYARCVEAGRHLSLDEAVEFCRAATAAIPPPAVSSRSDDAHGFAGFGLTPREIEIAQLLRQRLSDREIAARLFISPRTAGTHVTAILGKLGLSSRREVPDFAP